MTSPDPSTATEASAPGAVTRRSRSGWRVIAGIAGVVAVAFATTSCSPEMVAKDAIKEHWTKHAACAERIVDRESNFQADAVNRSSGATGLFQLMPSHAGWIKAELGYDFSEMKDPYKNAEAAKALSQKAYAYWGDGWQPWRLSGRAIRGGGCPA